MFYFMEFRTVSVLLPLNLSVKEALKMYVRPQIQKKKSVWTACMTRKLLSSIVTTVSLHCTLLSCIALPRP